MDFFSIEGFHPVDDDYRKKLAAYDACVEAGIGIPPELSAFFNHQGPDPDGMSMALNYAGKEIHTEDAYGLMIDLTKLPGGITMLKIYCST